MQEESTSPSPGDVVFGHVPQWMDSGFFERALGAGAPGLRVCRSEVSAATGKGENFVSVVYAARVTIASDGSQRHLIVKCLPSNKARKIMSNKAEFFRKEVDMYEVVFPEFCRLASGGPAPPWPVHHHTLFDGERDFIVMEDLRAAGYVMKERLAGLDAAHLRATLGALGKFHAFSYALKLKEPEIYRIKVYDLYPETMFSTKCEDMMGVFIRNAYKDTASAIREWGEPKYEAVAEWIEAAMGGALRDTMSLLSPDDPGALLNHGDCWVNNVLFRYPPSRERNEEPEEVKLLDFQISRVCSPAGDLSYLMATSVATPVRRAHWDTLLRNAYLGTFWSTLEDLGAKGLAESSGLYTWPWLQSEMLRYRPFALVVALTTTQVVMAETSDAPDLDTMTEEQLMGEDENSPFANLAKGKLYKVRLRDLLDEFLDEGLFQ